MGWFRPMGVDAVEYHKETVLGRGDDHPGQALDYYASRGETPLRWGGAVARRLGLVGEVTPEQYEAAFGPGGFRDPLTGERLVSTKTPGFEIVVGAHKATAVLGVVGRAEDMHAILDVETGATMDWLEASMQASGGRRGRAAVVTPTTGLAYAVTRHGTSRAGDPSLHDHVLIANLTEVRDATGGYKALFSALLRDRIEAATMIGRLHSAFEAVQRGYAIEIDNGPSGRLRHWRIKGIPYVVCEKLSKRSDAIGEYLYESGYAGYRARNVAARATRETKRGTGIDELQPRWEAELEEIGYPIRRLLQALESARTESTGPSPPLTGTEIDAITADLMDVDGPFLARGKVFTRTRLTQEVAPLLYGHDPAELDHVLNRIIASPLVMSLIGVAGARERVYTASEVLATEHAIAACVERLVDDDGPQLDPARILRAIAAKQDEVGGELSDGQYRAINSICGSGRAVDVVVGIAGSGKTTALAAAASALEEAGYTVIGTATSGQAARTLGQEAGIEARTMRSLLWQLDHGRIVLRRDSVVILDEAGMTADADMTRLLLAVEAARAKVVIVGDDRQLSAVGPGGALHQVLTDHAEIVTVLTQNMRQRDPAERNALLDLRSGDLERAIAFYADDDRVAVADDPTNALVAMVAAWATDTEAGHDTFLLAWQRNNVANLNRLARDQARQRGWLQGADMETPDGRLFAVGDIVVMLAPNYRGELVTSERARVVATNPDAGAITIETGQGRHVTLLGSELTPDRLAYGYALTVHREQGSTSDRTHYCADGGGRELAYVALSRARHRSTVWAVADNVDQAVERITTDWSRQQHDTWLTPVTTVGDDPRHQPTDISHEIERRRLQGQLDTVLALAPPDVTTDLNVTMAQLASLRADRDHVPTGTGRYKDTPIGRVARQLDELDADLTLARTNHAAVPPAERPKWERLIDALEHYQAERTDDWNSVASPEARRLDNAIATTERPAAQLENDDRFNKQWHYEHPEHVRRVHELQRAIHELDHPAIEGPDVPDQLPAVERHFEGNAVKTEAEARVDHIRTRLHRSRQPAVDPASREARGVEL